MNLDIYKETIYYILSPSNFSSGGPKHLHQLGAELKNLGKNVFMYYYPNNIEDPVHENLKSYDVPFTRNIEDSNKNILIVAEVNDQILVSKEFKNIQKVLFWQSLDHFFITHYQQNFSKYIKSIIKIPFKIINKFNDLTKNYFGNLSLAKYLKTIYLNFPFSNLVKKDDFKLNLAQSYYQHKILSSKNVETLYLNDFIRDEFFQAAKRLSLKDKENTICYYPVKSSSFMNRIIEKNPNLKFVPLYNYSIKEIIEILSKSKIYIDFGYHPGVDGLPREAAILRNCILTNKEGSAFYSEAVPIYEQYKFDEKQKNLIRIKKKINYIFDNFEDELKNFEHYVGILENEESIFKSRVAKIFDTEKKNQ
ncbi:hypothetical protein [Candidatus Pelagibacter communis]|uniref:hypothetical protein n=1 Tax=Pelagibacter ubique TaxID=198252 RepID=UPI00094D4023|nr:hypothetical protein [Candidatus Pelagibacter ubique]